MDFEDALAAAAMKAQNIETIYSYDRHFDRLNWVKRIEP
ncbi:MAG: PIN domain-containing protein [Patescibacteria group bacterium]|nr:PIN domain-containing protein [Patescibacteria group bacterium]